MALSYDLPGQHWYCSHIALLAAKATQIPSECPRAEVRRPEVEARRQRKLTQRPSEAGGGLEASGRVLTLNSSPPMPERRTVSLNRSRFLFREEENSLRGSKPLVMGVEAGMAHIVLL